MTSESTLRGLVDWRCERRDCSGKSMYRMVGNCSNCGLTGVLVLFTVEHEVTPVRCPRCHVVRVSGFRTASDDEIPAVVEGN